MWGPADWILRGTYCPRSDILTLLGQIRAAVGCVVLLHFAVDDVALLRTLTFASAQDAEASSVEDEVRDHLAPQSPRVRFLGYLLEAVAEDALPASTQKVLEKVTTELRRAPSLACLHGVRIAHSGIIGSPIRSILLALDGDNGPIADELINQLAVMVNATPSAEARRDTRVLEKVGELPGTPDGVQSSAPSGFLQAALDLAVGVTSSGAGALYLRDARRPLRLAVAARKDDEPSFIYPKVVDPTDPRDSRLLDVLGRQKSIHRRASSQFTRAPTKITGTELILPLPWTSAAPDGPAAGFIVLHKLSGTGSFTAYDRALIRNVSLRVGLRRYVDSATAIGVAIADMRRGFFSGSAPESVIVLPSHLPNDIESALARITGALPSLGEATDSHSVSLRILLPGTGAADAGLHDLVQVAVYPPEAKRSESLVLPPDDGANWTVVRTGRVVLHDDTNAASNYTRTRTSTRAEVSVPVRSEGRLVGTLNLESPYAGHYRTLAALIEAFGSAVGRVFADTSMGYARASLSRSIAVDGLAHDLRKKLDQALSALHAGSTSHDAVGTPLLKAASIIDQIRSHAEVQDLHGYTMRELVHSAIAEADMPTLRHAIRWLADIDDRTVPSHQTYILRPVLVQLLANLKDHGTSDISDGAEPSITIQCLQFDGLPHALIVFENRVDQELTQRTVSDLYRAPVDGSIKPGKRLGAYLAGVRVRSLGGSLSGHIASTDRRTYRSILTVPLAVTS
jgi:hypothetical protein